MNENEKPKMRSVFDAILKALSSGKVWLIALWTIILNFVWAIADNQIQSSLATQFMFWDMNKYIYIFLKTLASLPNILLYLLSAFMISYQIYKVEYNPNLPWFLEYFKKNYWKLLSTLSLYSLIVFIVIFLLWIMTILTSSWWEYIYRASWWSPAVWIWWIWIIVFWLYVLLIYLFCRISTLNYEIIDKNNYYFSAIKNSWNSTNGYTLKIFLNYALVWIILMLLAMVLWPIVLKLVSWLLVSWLWFEGIFWSVILLWSVIGIILSIIQSSIAFYNFYNIKAWNKKF